MKIINCILLTIVSICAKAQAEMCDVGVDGCSWTCKTTTVPGEVTCLAIPVTPVSCEIGSSSSICGTTCTCSKARTCKVGVDGCSWTCRKTRRQSGRATCYAILPTPETCVVGSSSSLCGTTCKCLQLNKCTVGVNGCEWTCVTASAPPGTVQCLAYPATPSECRPGEKSTLCGTTCTCSISNATS